MNGRLTARAVVAGVLLAAIACCPEATFACLAGPGWEPMPAAQRARLAPVVIVGKTEALKYYDEARYAAGDISVQCIVTGGGDGGANAVANFKPGDEVVITGFGDGAACLATPIEGRSSIFFVDPHDSDGEDDGLNGDFDARYDDIHSAVLSLSREHIIDVALAIDTNGIGPAADCARALYGEAVFDHVTIVDDDQTNNDADGEPTDDDVDGNPTDGEDGALTCLWHNGTRVPIGHRGKDGEDCNTCTCEEFQGQAMVACTEMACVGSDGAAMPASFALALLLAAAAAVAIARME